MADRPRLVIAAPMGRSGKTTLALALCAAFNARGLVVQPFKKGPDYIDPSWLSEAAGSPCYSLDPFFYADPQALLQAFDRFAGPAHLSLVEGNHGLFDSYDEEGRGSSAAVARLLKAPILLVVNTARTGRSIAAIVHGCQTFEPGTNIAGVVLNQVSQGRHETRLRQAIETYCGIPVLGAIPRQASIAIPDRHLGLVPSGENDSPRATIEACRQAAQEYLDLDKILDIARSAPPILASSAHFPLQPALSTLVVKIGLLRDRAFTFYYPENLQALESAGAELVPVDALHDLSLPPVDALYIGGGFPEMFMGALSANVDLRASIRQAVENNLPVYAECGGLMYLSRRIRWGDQSAEMVGVLPCEIEMTGSPQGHGYVVAEVDHPNPFFTPGTILRGHEFHNSRINWIASDSSLEPLNTAYHLERGSGMGAHRDGIVYRNVLASYTHLHCAAVPSWAGSLVERARTYHASLHLEEAR